MYVGGFRPGKEVALQGGRGEEMKGSLLSPKTACQQAGCRKDRIWYQTWI